MGQATLALHDAVQTPWAHFSLAPHWVSSAHSSTADVHWAFRHFAPEPRLEHSVSAKQPEYGPGPLSPPPPSELATHEAVPFCSLQVEPVEQPVTVQSPTSQAPSTHVLPDGHSALELQVVVDPPSPP